MALGSRVERNQTYRICSFGNNQQHRDRVLASRIVGRSSAASFSAPNAPLRELREPDVISLGDTARVSQAVQLYLPFRVSVDTTAHLDRKKPSPTASVQ